MKPLRESLDECTPAERAAAELLAKVTPLQDSEQRRARVWRALEERRAPSWNASPLRLAIVLAVLAVATAAGAWLGGVRLGRRPPFEPPAFGNAVSPPAAGAAQVATAPTENAPSPETASSAALVRPIGSAPSAHATASANPDPGGALMVAALEARRAGDAKRAAELAASYRSRFPHGPLQEEALTLLFELAQARGDSETAKNLATEYLHRYPNGRFRQNAERARREPSP